jgi:hypothetical protein
MAAMAAALLLFVIAVSFTVVRLGAAALELTGMTWDQAKFQALSAFTNSGFTTREAEAVVGHPVRRKIVSYLIILGNAGLVTTVGTFAGSVMGGDPFEFTINLAVMLVGIAFLLWLARKPKLAQRMRDSFQKRIIKRYGDLAPTPEAMLRLDEGINLSRISLPQDSPAAGRTLAELRLADAGIQVLAIERDGEFNPTPKGQDRLEAGDTLVVYGQTEGAAGVFGHAKKQALTLIPGEVSADTVAEASASSSRISAADVNAAPPV